MSEATAVVARLRVFVQKATSKLKIFVLEALLRPVRPPDMIRFGSYYGGWWIPQVDEPGAVAVCVGAGTDVTFDLELRRLGYEVYTVDPTPASVEYLQQFTDELHVLPVGVWTETGEIEFARDEVWTESWMIGAAATASTGVSGTDVFPVVTVKDLIARTGADEIALLKLDIEGAEHDVLRSMLADGVRPPCLCVEFDDHRFRRVVASVKLLRGSGYRLFQIEGLNYMFVLDAQAGVPSILPT